MARRYDLNRTNYARQAARDVPPLGKAGAPPFVIFGKGVELREIKGNQLGAFTPQLLGLVGCLPDRGIFELAVDLL